MVVHPIKAHPIILTHYLESASQKDRCRHATQHMQKDMMPQPETKQLCSCLTSDAHV